MPKPLRLLLVEDDEGDAALLLWDLRHGGFEPAVERVETLDGLRRALPAQSWDLIICDFYLSNCTGLEALARSASVPVVNALSDFEHPCQCLADLLTVGEKKGRLARITLAYVGDGNNVAHSLLLGGAKAGMNVRVGTPFGYEPIPQVVGRAEEIGRETGGTAMITHDPVQATVGADVLYTDVWASMGQEEEADERTLVFQPYRLDQEAVDRAARDVIVMHCLPAHRGQEITDEVIDGPHSVVWDQAENRLHTQKALLAWLLERT